MTTISATAPVAPGNAAAAPPPTTPRRSALRGNALGFPALLAQSIALISPTMTAVLIIPLAFSDAGQGTWLAYLFGTLMLLFVVLGLNQFASRSASAGSMYGYTGRALGAKAGVFSGWTLIWSYLFIAIAGLTGFAIFSAQLLSALGFHGTVPPVIFFAISAATCWAVACKDIRLSSILMLVLEGASVTCILSLAAIVLFHHGFTVDTNEVHLSGVHLHGMSLAVVVCIFSLVGFESATTLGGEAKRPLHNVPRAVIWSLLITGTFFVVMGYIEVYGTRHYGTSLDSISAPLNVLSQIYGVSFFKIPLSIGAMVSFFSLTLSCLNAGARIIFPMGEHGFFPKKMGHVHGRNGTPTAAITTFIILIVGVASVLEITTNPLTIFGDAGTLAAFGFLLAYFMISIAAPVYLKKLGQLRARHLVIAVLAFICLMVPTIGSFYPVPAFPVNIFPYIFLTWLAVGAVWLFVTNRRQPEMLAEIEADLEQSVRPAQQFEPHEADTLSDQSTRSDQTTLADHNTLEVAQ
jgi:amino acid transporter